MRDEGRAARSPSDGAPGGGNGTRPRIGRMEESEIPAAASLAREAFADHPIYQASLGLDAEGFESLWKAFLALSLSDPSARVYAARLGGEVAGVLVVSRPEFPSTLRGLRFLGRLWRETGLLPVLRYLRLCASYERVLRRPARERRIEARGIWLAASPRRGPVRIGGMLARHALEELGREGRTLITGVVDAANPRLVSYYRRMGFAVGDPVPVPGGRHCRIEMRIPGPAGGPGAAGEGAPCSSTSS